MPPIEGFFVYCCECGEEVQVGPGTFARVIAGESFMVCSDCTSMATYCAENGSPTTRVSRGRGGATPSGKRSRR